MSKASNAERYMLKLINHDRAQAGLDPLRFSSDLNTAAERHSGWMINKDVFSHTGGAGSTPTERMQHAGYHLKGNWRTGENIALQSERGNAGIMDDVRDLHRMLMQSPEHRANILNPQFHEIGIGIDRGMFRLNGSVFDAAVVTQDFGRSAAHNNRQSQPSELATADHFVMREMNDDNAPSAQESNVLAVLAAFTHTQTEPHAVPHINADAFDWATLIHDPGFAHIL